VSGPENQGLLSARECDALLAAIAQRSIARSRAQG